MKKELIYVSTLGMSYEDWLQYRYTGIGASEVGCIMGLDSYKTPAELFLEKIGREVRPTIENMAMFHGKELEDYVAGLWEYWDGDELSIIRNKAAGKKVRRMRKINAYVRNPKYPWLFVSVDRIINKHKNKGEGALELKTTSNYNVKKWDGDINPAHIMQLQTQTGVCEFEYGELANFIDGRKFDVYEFEYMRNIFEAIVDTTNDFWKRVTKGKALAAQHFEAKQNFDFRAAEHIQLEIDKLEPPAVAGDVYLDFLSDKYKNANPGLVLDGSEELLLMAQQHKLLGEKIERIRNDRSLVEANIKNYMKDAVEINFREAGRVTWKPNVKGSRVFNNLIK